jgi:alginate O-acetyltransferase complex protein AlgI
MITMLLGGLWHGASWTFVVWGGLHGFYLAVERFLKETVKERPWFSSWAFKLSMALLTYFLVNITWVFFRAEDFGHAALMISSMFGVAKDPAKVLYWNEIIPAALVVAGMVATHWALRATTKEAMIGKMPLWLIILAGTFMLFMLIITQGSDSAFIYFQF